VLQLSRVKQQQWVGQGKNERLDGS
jgi:hypothetical protein